MRKQLLFINLTVCLILFASLPALSQEQTSTIDKIANFPSRFFEKLQKNSAEMEEKLIARSTKALKKLARQEARLKKKLAKKDSLAAEQVFGNVEEKFQQMQAQLEKPEQLVASGKEYMPHLDSLKTSLNFLSENSNLLPGGTEQLGKLKQSLEKNEAAIVLGFPQLPADTENASAEVREGNSF